MHDIFLSYSRTDTEIMQKVKQTLLDADFNVWTDEGIEPGTRSWKRAIQQVILDTRCLICILSPDAAKSEWVLEELDYAQIQKKPVFLILARGDEQSSIPFGYSTHQWTDIRIEANYTKRINRLIVTAQRRIGKKLHKEEQPSVELDHPEIYLGWDTKLDNKSIKEIETDFARSRLPASQKDAKSNLPTALERIKSIMPEPFDLCYIPAGKVTLEAGGYVPEGGQTYQVDAFFMAKYPITNNQFAKFIDEGGYRTQSFWIDEGWELCQENDWIQPRFLNNIKWNLPNHPIVGITWYEAIAFCNWLNIKLHGELYKELKAYKFTLPSEQQWQRAAKGDNGWLYPWGNYWIKDTANIDNVLGKTSAVNNYESGKSPYGVLDMLGNVWEWCLNDWDTGKILVSQKAARRALHGGSWNSDKQGTRASMRDCYSPLFGSNEFGFRICAVPVQSE